MVSNMLIHVLPNEFESTVVIFKAYYLNIKIAD